MATTNPNGWEHPYLHFVGELTGADGVFVRLEEHGDASLVGGQVRLGAGAAEAFDRSGNTPVRASILRGESIVGFLAAHVVGSSKPAARVMDAAAEAVWTYLAAADGRLYRQAFESAGVPMVLSNGAGGEIVGANRAFLQVAAASPDEVAGRSWAAVFSGSSQASDHGAEARSSLIGSVCLKTKLRASTASPTIAVQSLLAEGENAVALTAFPEWNACAAAAGDLPPEASRFRSLVELNTDWISLLDRDGRVIYETGGVAGVGTDSAKDVDAGVKTLPSPMNRWVNRPFIDRVIGEDRMQVEQAIRSVMSTEGASTVVAFRQRSGEADSRWFEAVVSNRLGTPALASIVVAAREITHRKAVEERIALADRLASLGTLAAGMAHEINNPLTYIASNLTYVRRAVDFSTAGEALPPDLLEAIDEASGGVRRIQRIVKDLGDYAMPATSEHVVETKEILERAVSLASNELRHRGRLHVSVADALPQVFGDEAKVTQVFVNLLLNAAQALPQSGGEVWLQATADAASVHVEIADSGTGIPPEVASKIFDLFFTTKEVGKGTGLGLSFCHATVTSMGGSIAFRAREGGGTIFSVTLPAFAPVRLAPGRRPRVLIVDDETMVLRAMQRIFADDFEIELAGSAAEAQARILSGAPLDCILCDIMMPEITGVDLYAEVLRRRPALANKFVFMTGGAFTPSAREFLDSIGGQYVRKPVNRAAVLQAVSAVHKKGQPA